MIQMQRSFSLPGHAHASPPLCPTVNHDAPRAPALSPAPAPVPAAFNRLTKSQWLLGPEGHYTTIPRTTLTPQDVESVEGQKKCSSPPGVENATAKPVRKVLQLPLLQDVSQYTNVHFRDVTTEAASTTLEELAHLVRLSRYLERKRSQNRIRLQRALVSTALSARLARCGELAHRTLVENFRADDKKSFANIYNAIYDVRNSCDATRRYALLEPDLDIGRSGPDGMEDPGSYSTFMHDVPSRARETLLHFLCQIRTNLDFLAARIASLTSTEIWALTLFHQGLDPIESVLPFHTRTRGHNPAPTRNSAHVPSAVERLLSFQRHDPLSALIHTCFANSAGPDSAEDVRRTEIWANVCARLITESKSGAENFICCVLNIWTAMRDWSGRSNMEWYLMKILEDGAFLLEKAEDQAGTRIHVEPRNAKDAIAADEFYEGAVKGLFEFVDDSGAGGIPDGLLELGNAILRKLDPKRHGATRAFLVSKWLFSVFLVNATIHPESFGMMSEYHITEYGRQKILKEVAMRVQRLVVDMTWKQSAATPPDIRAHIDNIMARFRTTRHSKSNPRLFPARSITSLRETVEVHPYLVISPSDLVTLVNALYPERRPTSSSLEKDIHINGLRSSTSSVSGMSGISMPMPVPQSSRGFDTASIISTSASSVFSDTTSREPLLDDGSSNNRFSSTSISSLSQTPRVEDDGLKFRMAVREMSRALGNEITSGSCHPCAEQWAVIFMNSDGHQLSTQMIHDYDDDGDEDEDTESSESSLDISGSRPDLDKDYHQLRDSILKLVEDYEIPHTPDLKSGPKTFSNKTSFERLKKKQRARGKTITPAPQSRNPYRTRESSPHYQTRPEKLSAERQTLNHDSQDPSKVSEVTEEPPVLLRMLAAAESQCRAQSDFVNAHLYWRTSQQLQQISSHSLKQHGFVSLLSIFSRGPRDSIRQSATAIEEYDAWLVWLKQSQERHDVTIEAMMKRIKALRDKMWYVTDVRNSAAYEGARAVAVALKSMGQPKNKYLNTTSTRQRSSARISANNFLLRSEAQVLDILAASDEYGGPNKLSDDQADKTSNWLTQYGIENFCRGEERIHRFCLEIDTCINKLVGDSLMEGPVLWSSELYYRDKRILDSGRQKGDLVLTGIGTLALSGDFDQELDAGRRSLRGVDIASPMRSGQRDLRSMSARNTSQQSLESSRWSISRSSTGGDIMDSQDYFGTSSPVLTIDSTTTFWSPFHTRVQSPSTSVGSYRPGTASTTNETVMVSSSENSGIAAKQNFLAELKQALTSLLISDLGTLVFARGSETDSWFSGELGQECMERKERQERKVRKKKRVIEKKRSFRDLRSAQKTDVPISGHIDEDQREKGVVSLERSTQNSANLDTHSITDTSSTTSDTISASSHTRQSSDKAESPDFPYKSAFHRLLKMFSVHPNPYAKLNALYELERLIVVSRTSLRRRKSIRQDVLPNSPLSPSLLTEFTPRDAGFAISRANNLEEAIDNVKERRSHTIFQSDEILPLRRAADNRSMISHGATSTDMIVDALQDLFREADIRPKTLFRDLQFIAAFVPASILDKTDRGKAFWDAGLAALGLKQDVCRTLIEIADEIVLHYTQTRQASTMAPGDAKGITNGQVMRYGMQDAAKMWTVTAKEGDPVAERELAIFYLTHPELVERTTLPLTKSRETFKAQVMEMHGGDANSSSKEGDRERNDPATMCVAYHWMELSALGGDELAKKYLRQREELNALP